MNQTYSDPSYIFSGGQDRDNPEDLRPLLQLLLRSLHWLTLFVAEVNSRATLRQEVLSVFKTVKLGTRSYVNELLKPREPVRALRSSNINLLRVPCVDTSAELRRLSVAGPRVGMDYCCRSCVSV